MKVRPGAVVRGAGVTLACLAPDPARRSTILFAAFGGAWFLNKPGLRSAVVFPDAEEPWKRGSVSFVTSVSSWSTVMLAATAGLRRTRLPVPIAAALLGGSVVVIDSLLADLGDAREAAEAAEADAVGLPTR
jgi:hypothetical protein